MVNKKLIQEDLDRFNSILNYGKKLNEDVTDGNVIDPTGGEEFYRSEDPAQIDMFTQLAGDERSQIMQQFITDSDIDNRLKRMLKTVDGLSSEWESMMDAFESIMREKQKVVEGSTDLDKMWYDMEEIGVAINHVEESIFYVKDDIDKITMGKDEYRKKSDEILRNAMKGFKAEDK